MQQLGEELSKFFTSETSLALYQSTIRKLLSFEEIMARAAIDPKKRLVLQQSFESASANVASQPKRSTLQRGGTIDHSTAHVSIYHSTVEPLLMDTPYKGHNRKNLH